MQVDTRLRPALPPRALALVTGEHLPSGYSTTARLFPIEVTRGAIDPTKLSAAQAQRHLLPAAMAGYLANEGSANSH